MPLCIVYGVLGIELGLCACPLSHRPTGTAFCPMILISQSSSHLFYTLIFSQKVLAQGTQVSCRWPWSIILLGPEALPLSQRVWLEPLACERASPSLQSCGV